MLVHPLVGTSCFCPSFEGVLYLHVDKCLRASAEAACSCVVNVGHGVYRDLEATADGLSLTWNIQTVIYESFSTLACQLW